MDQDFLALKKGLATHVRRLRLARGISQEQLAFDAAIDRTYVSQLERSVVNPSLLVLYKVAKALGVSVRDLLRGPDDTSRGRRKSP